MRAFRSLGVIPMAKGGARSRSGPAPDPNALRRDRATDAGWVTLPLEGFQGVVPDWPLPAEPSYDEIVFWERLWRRPQAVMWDRLRMQDDVAAYVRAFLEAVEPGASAGLKTAVLRMAAEIGLSLPGMHSLRWKFAEDELQVQRDERVVPTAPSSARDRLRALNA